MTQNISTLKLLLGISIELKGTRVSNGAARERGEMSVAVESVLVRTAAVGSASARKEVDIDRWHQAGHVADIAAETAPVAVEADINPWSRQYWRREP